MEQFVLQSCIRGYHIYKDAWASSISEMLIVNMKLLTITIVFLCGRGKKRFGHRRLASLVIQLQKFRVSSIIQQKFKCENPSRQIICEI